jgi:hypothetical protein
MAYRVPMGLGPIVLDERIKDTLPPEDRATSFLAWIVWTGMRRTRMEAMGELVDAIAWNWPRFIVRERPFDWERDA